MHEQLPPFPGFQPAAFDFLKQLVLNNEREWFKARKATYDDEIVWPMQCLLAEATREAGARGFTLTADPKKSIFRIYRDTRFSKNKAPYKTAAGAVLTRNGTNKSFGGVYIHLEPDQCFLAAGFWHPDNDKLRAWRSYMANHQHDFMSMVDKLAESKLELESDEALKRMPRGFEDYAGTDVESYLKWKSFTTSRKFKDKAYQNAGFIDEVMRFMEEVYPFLLFGWDTE